MGASRTSDGVRVRIVRTAVAAAVAMALAGCGSDSGPDGGSGSRTDSAADEATTIRDDLETVRADRFTVLLPKGAKRQEQPVPGQADLTLVLYGVEVDDGFYGISYTDVPEGTTLDPNGAVDGSAANIGGTAVDKKPLTHQGFDALDARIVGVMNSGVEGTAFTRVVATPGRLYQVLTVIRGKDKPVTGTHLRIADSLQFS